VSGSWRTNYIYVGTFAGNLCVASMKAPESMPAEWIAFSAPVSADSELISSTTGSDVHEFLGCRWPMFGASYRLIVPLWIGLVACGVLAVAPWMPAVARSGYRLRLTLGTGAGARWKLIAERVRPLTGRVS
jgi:hypothetical protein